MRYLTTPDPDDVGRLGQLKQSQAGAAKVIEDLHSAIEARYNAYTAASGDPWLILQDPMFKIHKDDFESLYERPPVALKSYLKNLRYGLNGACPMCGRDNLGTLDHYLSKANYPEFSLFSKNLIPACSRCNTQRQTSVKGVAPGERALHPYFDAFATRRLLTIELIPSAIEPRWLAPLIRLVPFGVTPAEAAIVQWQIDNVILPAGFQSYTERIWADFVRAPADFFDRGPDLLSMCASLDLLIRVDERHTDSMNSWRACIYHGIRNCPDALIYLAGLITGPVAPAATQPAFLAPAIGPAVP